MQTEEKPVVLNDNIYSQFGNLVQVQSGETGNSANDPNCDFVVWNCPGCNTPSACNSVQFNPQNLVPISSGELDEEQARLVATDSMQYAEYNEVADWYGKYRLYERLDLDSLLMNSTPEFSGFYALQQLTQKEDILRTNLLLQSLIDSTLHSDTLLWQARVSQTWAQNSTISSGYDYENNEQELNAMYLTVLQYGYDTLNANQKQRLEELAYSCPFIEGPAVLKARMLHAHYSPGIDYNTLAICNAASVFKNGKGLFDDEDSLLITLSGTPLMEKAISMEEMILYPNPTNGLITMKYNLTDDADIVFYTIVGQEVFRMHLSSKVNYVQGFLPELPQGVYSYKIVSENNCIKNGKLILK